MAMPRRPDLRLPLSSLPSRAAAGRILESASDRGFRERGFHGFTINPIREVQSSRGPPPTESRNTTTGYLSELKMNPAPPRGLGGGLDSWGSNSMYDMPSMQMHEMLFTASSSTPSNDCAHTDHGCSSYAMPFGSQMNDSLHDRGLGYHAARSKVLSTSSSQTPPPCTPHPPLTSRASCSEAMETSTSAFPHSGGKGVILTFWLGGAYA